MNEWWITAPILIPLATLIACLGLPNRAAVFSITGMAAMLAAATKLWTMVAGGETLTAHAGGWQAPYGIALALDPLSAMMLWVSALTGLAVLVYGLATSHCEKKTDPRVHVLVHGLMLGVNGSFVTGDLFNLYVWFEVMLISSFVLMVREGRAPQLAGGLAYVLLNLLGSAMFLCGAGLLYGKLGTLNLADLAVKLGTVDDPGFVNTTGALLFIAFAGKAALFPFHFWLPASYHHAGPAVSALFAGLLTKVGVYALLRVFTLVFTPANGFSAELILWLSMATMLLGVLGAVAQYHVRRLLAFHIISQIGYMTAGLAIGGKAALAAVIFYIIHHIVVKSTLFLAGGVLEARTGTADIRHHGGFYQTRPLLAFCFLVPALSLGGIPPFSGFWAKLNLVQAAVERGQWIFLAAALGVGMLTLFSMIKIWNESFWKEMPAGSRDDGEPPQGRPHTAMLALCAVTLALSLGGGFVFDFAETAAAGLIDPSGYIDAVLKGGTP